MREVPGLMQEGNLNQSTAQVGYSSGVDGSYMVLPSSDPLQPICVRQVDS